MFQFFDIIISIGQKFIGSQIKRSISRESPEVQKRIWQAYKLFWLLFAVTVVIAFGIFLFVTFTIFSGQIS
jgi:heme/copper-type cytochrome/quinol oxidase subunit 2